MKEKDQIDRLNTIAHKLWFNLHFHRPDTYSEILKGLSSLEQHIMYLANRNPSLILKDIRNRFKIPQTTLSSMISKLEKKGLIERIINRRDMRSFSIRVTEAGKEIVKEHNRMDRELMEKHLNKLTQEERDSLESILVKISANM